MKRVDDIFRQLQELRDLKGYKHVFLLVDPLSGNVPLDRWSGQLDANKQWALRDPQVRDTSFPCPRLLLLSEADDDILEESVIAAGALDGVKSAGLANPAICGWLFARGITADVPRHLVAAAQQRNAKYEPVLVRYYDPRVLTRLNQILEPEQRQQLLGPVSHWFALDRFGEASDFQTQTPAPHISPALSLTDDQWISVERIEAFNRTLAAYQELAGAPLQTDRESLLSRSLEQSAANGFTSIDDLIICALYALSIHPDFNQHPAVVEALEHARTSKLAIADEFSRLPEHVWNEITNLKATPQ